MFSFLKKKDDGKKQSQPLDSANLPLESLTTGFSFDYELSTWEIVETDEYKWENGSQTKKLKIKNAYETVFLLLEIGNTTALKVMERIELETLSPELKPSEQKLESPIQAFNYQNEKFVFNSEQVGIMMTQAEKGKKTVSLWTYSSPKNTVVELEQIEGSTIHARIGHEIPAHLITNISTSNN